MTIHIGTVVKNILVVDDDNRIQVLLKDELEEEGHNVTVVSNGKEAISHLKNGHKKPDLVILDLRMPKMDGLETMALILKLKMELPVIIFSAYRTYNNDPIAMAADAYVVKSSDLSELKKKIRSLV